VKGVSTRQRPIVEGKRWVVEEIVGHKLEDGDLSFQLKWQGFKHPTWEAEHQLDCPLLVQAYFALLKRVPAADEGFDGTPAPK
jgi:hypothetical protein